MAHKGGGHPGARCARRNHRIEPLERRTLLSDALFEDASYNDLAYDAAGTLHAAWYDESAQQLMYARKPATGGWTAPAAVPGTSGAGTQVSIATDATHGVGVAFVDPANADRLLYRYRSSAGTWSAQEVIPRSPN